MVTIFLGVLAVAWICVGAQVVLQRRRAGQADSSVHSFRQQLSTLERATPGTMMRQSMTGPVPVVTVDAAPATPEKPTLSPQRRRRRDVLIGLGGTTAFLLVVTLLLPGFASRSLFFLSAASLTAYIYALRQLHVRASARSVTGVVPAVGVPPIAPKVTTTTTVLPQSFAAN